MDIACKSSIGKKKKVNEDRFLFKTVAHDLWLTAVADGLGGQPSGHVASEVAIQAIQNWTPVTENFEQEAVDLIFKADASVTMLTDVDSDLEYMGTTLTLAIIFKNKVFWAHVGDTRIYLYKNQILNQITKDQTMAQFLVDEGELSEIQALDHPMQNLLDQSLGSGDCEPDSGSFDICPGETLLLCSDGLYSEINDLQITKILAEKKQAQDKTDILINCANQAGGKDNITAVIVEY